MSDLDHQSRITLEDLLRLKKVERPSADFWVTFERELRQKQLSALVEKRASWRDIPRFFGRRAYLPIGATAILAFTLVSMKFYTPVPVAQATEVVPVSATPESTEFAIAAVPSNETAYKSPAVSSPLVNRADQTVVLTDNSQARVSQPAAESAPESLQSKFVPAMENSPSARSIAANYARLEQSEPELISSVLGTRLSSSARVRSAASAPVIELASLQTVSSKRTRLLARYNERPPIADLVAPDSVRERVSRKLGDNDFNDHFNRVGVKGDKVSLKF